MAFADKKQASKYVYGYTKDKYDRVNLLLPKGRLQEVKDLLEPKQSVNAWINDAINDKLKGD